MSVISIRYGPAPPCRVLMRLLPCVVKVNGTGGIFFVSVARCTNLIKTKAMEANSKDKIRLITVNSFDLPEEELKKLYTYLALFQYRYLRIPEYNEKALLIKFHREIKKFLVGSKELMEKDQNNHTLHQITTFFDNHHKHLSKIIEKEKIE